MNEPRRNPVDYEGTPLTRQEYISAIVHLYRGEMARATAWRIRLDTTTNWAVLTTAGLLAFGFRSGDNPHWVLLFGIALITLLLGYEARRYQMFDVWRARVRKIEENFYGPILTRDPVSPQAGWGERVARDLLNPSYKIGFRQAVRARFLRNYWAIYAVLLLSWMVKIVVHPKPAHNWQGVRDNIDYRAAFLPRGAGLRRGPGARLRLPRVRRAARAGQRRSVLARRAGRERRLHSRRLAVAQAAPAAIQRA